jgi:hypothetical protein
VRERAAVAPDRRPRARQDHAVAGHPLAVGSIVTVTLISKAARSGYWV